MMAEASKPLKNATRRHERLFYIVKVATLILLCWKALGTLAGKCSFRERLTLNYTCDLVGQNSS